MVRILTRLGEVKRAAERYAKELVDFRLVDADIYGHLRAILAAENVKVRAGEIKPIKIKRIRIPPNHLVYLCAYATHGLGHVIAAGEEVPLPITMERSADHATFVAALPGEIKKNDLLGVLIVLPVELTH
ncbi:MAG TPA: DUF22 domain-containing protein [Methanothermobacter sp.]|nr:conserved hypothetical protein [Methanothermobacter sp. MT-2]HHW05375.1 DUF22 domain-containing protein [Methanothermobacter sp.]HOK73130.1 DUF22 domain-containing protein [Methanothermobacter sp.]HOL68762.1 DUF22 domain-containing protein [Methanothermobacter sp.]HPQ04655.1 DUF22 domain-containing protein [Methanothermobacter sp.]